ncbi:hypothetical protein [Erythrobacter sp. HI0063]|uniref:hypothetical protein n=1 Tax=Erythrobacter sp. HI0063 TaxID=1822240 RepID=UPI0012E96265|nr:hypothetical protein [Erythrobacter sp. HI0063]
MRFADERKVLADEAFALKIAQAGHRTRVEALERREVVEAAKSDNFRRWAEVIALAGKSPELFKITDEDDLGLSDVGRRVAPVQLQAQLRKVAPDWAQDAARSLMAAWALSEQRTAALTDMIARAGPILSPKQEEAVSEAKKVIRQFGMPPPGVER